MSLSMFQKEWWLQVCSSYTFLAFSLTWGQVYTQQLFLGRETNLPYLSSLLPKFGYNTPSSPPPSQQHTLEEELDQIIDLMHRHDTVSIRQQFEPYSKPIDELKNLVYGAVLFPIGNSQKLQLKLSGPL